VGHASGHILAGILIAKWGYLHACCCMAAILVLAILIFVLSVDKKKRVTLVCDETI
jgi:predicted MFS family arabinose efflux permease